MIPIVQKEDPILRAIAKPVTPDMFGSSTIKKILRDMKSALKSQDDGVAIAAPQIGVSLRIFVVSGRVFEMLYPDNEQVSDETSSSAKSVKKAKKYPDMVFINPEILKLSKEQEEMEEGCLSVRYLYGKIRRSKKAKVRAQNEKGEIFEVGGSGLLAQIFQHETDHLDGHLFIDNATDVHDTPPPGTTEK